MSKNSLDLAVFDPKLAVLNLEKKIEIYSDFIAFKVEERDWESVSNIACRLREIEAQIKVWEKFVSSTNML